jgi:two-component system, response regulator FlrC
MRVLIIGSLAGELGQAARIAMARGAKLDQADDSAAALVRLRAELSSTALVRLVAHGWRGNVRELENTIHRAVLLAEGAEIGPEAIELGTGSETVAPAAGGVSSLVGRTMEEVERDLILQTVGHTLGNRTHAATILGISIRALRNKLRDYAAQGLPVPPPAQGVAAA